MRPSSLILLAGIAAFLAVSGLAAAAPEIKIPTYQTSDGQTQLGGGDDVYPVGATLTVRVWADTSCPGGVDDTVEIDWDDDEYSNGSFSGAFALSFEHTYEEAGSYDITATQSSCSDPGIREITVGSDSVFAGLNLPIGPDQAVPLLCGVNVLSIVIAQIAWGSSRRAPRGAPAAPIAVPVAAPPAASPESPSWVHEITPSPHAYPDTEASRSEMPQGARTGPPDTPPPPNPPLK